MKDRSSEQTEVGPLSPRNGGSLQDLVTIYRHEPGFVWNFDAGLENLPKRRLSFTCPITLTERSLQGFWEPPASCKLLNFRTFLGS